MIVVLITGLLVLCLSRPTVEGTQLSHDHQDLIITCSPDEVIRIHSADVFIPDPDSDREQCELTAPTCAPEEDLLSKLKMHCNEQQCCTVEENYFHDMPCVQSHTRNTIRVTYSCSKIFQGCLEDGDQEISCPPEHIEIQAVEVGIIPIDPETGSKECLLDQAVCSWTIDQSLIEKYYVAIRLMNGLTWTKLYSSLWELVCSEQQRHFFIRVAYYCNETSKEYIRCREDDDQGFGCSSDHQINVHSVEVGFNSRSISLTDARQCSLTEDSCSWSVDHLNYQYDKYLRCNEEARCSLSSEMYKELGRIACSQQHHRIVAKVEYNCNNAFKDRTYTAIMSTTKSDITKGKVLLTNGAVAGIIVGFVLLLLLLVVLAIVIVCLYRRLVPRRVSNARNSRVENAPRTYEIPSIENSEYRQYETIQSEARAPAQSANASKPSAAPPRSRSQHDTTLIDNYLYD